MNHTITVTLNKEQEAKLRRILLDWDTGTGLCWSPAEALRILASQGLDEEFKYVWAKDWQRTRRTADETRRLNQIKRKGNS